MVRFKTFDSLLFKLLFFLSLILAAPVLAQESFHTLDLSLHELQERVESAKSPIATTMLVNNTMPDGTVDPIVTQSPHMPFFRAITPDEDVLKSPHPTDTWRCMMLWDNDDCSGPVVKMGPLKYDWMTQCWEDKMTALPGQRAIGFDNGPAYLMFGYVRSLAPEDHNQMFAAMRFYQDKECKYTRQTIFNTGGILLKDGAKCNNRFWSGKQTANGGHTTADCPNDAWCPRSMRLWKPESAGLCPPHWGYPPDPAAAAKAEQAALAAVVPKPVYKGNPRLEDALPNPCAHVLKQTTLSVLFVGFTLMFAGFIMCCAFALGAPYGRRRYHYASIVICGIASLAYLVMSAGGDARQWAGCVVRSDGRAFFYARYIDWVITTPLLLYDLTGVLGIAGDEVLGVIGLDVLMIAAGLMGGMDASKQRWVFYAFGLLMFVPIVWMLTHTFPRRAKPGSQRAKVYSMVMAITVVTWIAYPVVWVLGEGTGYLDQTTEVLLYAILDIIAKCVFAFVLLQYGRNRMEPEDEMLYDDYDYRHQTTMTTTTTTTTTTTSAAARSSGHFWD